jgi:MFS transporter, putative metabolite:H+ symporter
VTGTPSLLEIVDGSPLDLRYWRVFTILALAYMLDYFDFFIVSYLIADVGPRWQLTYGEIAVILLSGGIGSIIGSLGGGLMSDRYGRRPVLIVSNLVCGLSAGAIALLADGSWFLFSLLRFISGVALGAIAAAALAYVVERTPGRYRKIVVGLNMVAPSAGIALASTIAGLLLEQLGWRGVAATAAAPIVTGILIWLYVGESVPWLLAQGRSELARQSAQKQLGRTIESLPAPRPASLQPAARMRELLVYPRHLALVVILGTGVATGIYGTYLWGPAVLAMSRSITAAEAARLFLLASAAGISGKIVFSLVPHFLGRRKTALWCTALGALSLALTVTNARGNIGALPVIMLPFMGMAFFLEGGLANIFPYAAELYPARLTARGAGLVHAGVGAGKILGPLSLSVAAGSTDVIRPHATMDAVGPAFIFLAACAASAFLALLLIRIKEPKSTVETNRLADVS